jgi:hypothetical protein
MAYVPGSPFAEDKKKDAQDEALGAVPMSGTSGVSSMVSAPLTSQATGGGAAPATPSGSVGTGFVNLDRYLAANQGIDKPVAEKGGAINKAVKSSIDSQGKTKQGEIESQVITTGNAEDLVSKAAAGDAAAAATADKILSQTFTAPDTKIEGPSKEQQQSLSALSNVNTVGMELSKGAGYTEGNYSPQLSALDRMLYGNLAQGATADVAKESGLNEKTRASYIEDLQKSAAQRQADFDKYKAGFRDQVSTYGGGIAERAKSTAEALKRDQEAARAAAEQGLLPGQTVSVVDGDVTVGNTIGDADRAKLDYISKLLGDPALAAEAKTGDVKRRDVTGENVVDRAPITTPANGGAASVSSIETFKNKASKEQLDAYYTALDAGYSTGDALWLAQNDVDVLPETSGNFVKDTPKAAHGDGWNYSGPTGRAVPTNSTSNRRNK